MWQGLRRRYIEDHQRRGETFICHFFPPSWSLELDTSESDFFFCYSLLALAITRVSQARRSYSIKRLEAHSHPSLSSVHTEPFQKVLTKAVGVSKLVSVLSLCFGVRRNKLQVDWASTDHFQFHFKLSEIKNKFGINNNDSHRLPDPD